MTPTTIEEALLADVLDHPEDDALRLILADWYEENGQPSRAAFIRDQVLWLPGAHDFDLLSDNLETWCPWFERHDELGFRRCHGKGGAIEVRHFGQQTTYWRRGFISEVQCLLADWLRHGPVMVRGMPIEQVWQADAHVYLRRVDGEPAGRVYVHDGALPHALYDCIESDDVEPTRPSRVPAWKRFPSWDDGVGALSRALILWARRQPV